jgi:hypothetical protein
MPDVCCVISFGELAFCAFVVESSLSHEKRLFRLSHPTMFVSASLKGIHFRRFEGGPDRAAASSEHTRAEAAAQEQAVLNSSFFPAT